MDSAEETRKRIGTFFLLIVLTALLFFMLKPILLAGVGGLLLAYICFPLYARLLRLFKNRNAAASILVIIIALVMLIPLWFATPLLIEQIFNLFRQSQSLDVGAVVRAIFPTASEVFTVQMIVTFNSIISNASSAILNWLVNIFINIPHLVINIFIAGLVFFFALRDHERFARFVADISPLARSKEEMVIKHFKSITNSIIFGQIIVGIAQGLFAALGLFVFGIPSAFVLSIVAVILSIIPFIGPAVLWIPITIFLFAQGNSSIAIAYLLYNVFIVSTIDNVLRAYIVSRRTKISQIMMLVGMIGGVLLFGVLGLILGPLIIAYFMMFLELYRSKKLHTAFID